MLRTLILASLLLPASALARDWQVDAAKSSLTFKGSYQKETFNGSFRKFDATIAYDATDTSKSSFDVTVDLASADTGNGDRDESLKGGDFFAIARFPKAHFTTTAFAKSVDGSVEAKGSLTIRDQTRPVVLKLKFDENGNTATLDVDTILKRADFALGASSDWADVGAEVPVHGHLMLTAK